jgi:hypothetical protein
VDFEQGNTRSPSTSNAFPKVSGTITFTFLIGPFMRLILMRKHLLLHLKISLSNQLFFAQRREEQRERMGFDSYRSSILNNAGKESVHYVDAKTIGNYSNILHLARPSDSLALDSMNVLDKFMVLSIRYRTPNKLLKSFDARSLLGYAIKECRNGWHSS